MSQPTRAYQSFEAFFPFYLQEHAKPRTRHLHYVGTLLVIIIAAAAVATGRWGLLLAMPVAGYFFAWVSHAVVERNRPATFTYPLWSLMADFRMFFLAMTGRLGPHLDRAGVAPAPAPAHAAPQFKAQPSEQNEKTAPHS